MINLNEKINKGCLWLDKTWQDAIDTSIAVGHLGDAFIEMVYKANNFSHFQLVGYGNNKRYVTRIPAGLNDYVAQWVDYVNVYRIA